jgi:O-acetyl-ADP-ribose deacetylase (regulator of RNase III)
MIHYTQGNLLETNVDALVNTVNTVGVMGKGIALMFKERFPKNMSAYVKGCKAGEVVTGKMFVTETAELIGAQWIINFPTKQHWRAKSQMVFEPTIKYQNVAKKSGVANWPAGTKWAERKLALFDDKSLQIAIDRLSVAAL